MVKRWTYASAVIAILLAISLYGCYSFFTMPSTRSKSSLDLSYQQNAEYVYTAHVKPSIIYDNRTTISVGEPLHLKLIDQLDITLNYNLTSTPKTFDMTDVSVSYEASATLSGGDWSKTYVLKPKASADERFSDTYTLEMKGIQSIVEAIGKETGTTAYSYIYTINPRIILEASAGVTPIVQEFTPTLTVKFEAGKILVEGLRSAKAGSVTHIETETATRSILGLTADVPTVRIATVISSIALGALLVFSVRNTLRERASRSYMDTLDDDIREKIIEASDPPQRIEKAMIKVASLEDLAKVAEEAFKPIIHHSGVFYVLDGDMRYEFNMAAVSADVIPEKTREEKTKIVTRQSSIAQSLIDRSLLFFGLPGAISLLIAAGFALWAIQTLQTASYFSTNMVFLTMVFTDVGLILITISLVLQRSRRT
jgi:hypothetical protein